MYTFEPIDDDIAEIFLKDLSSLSPDDSSSLEVDLSFAEFETCLKQMQDNKYPGPDGLTKAFYLKFFDLIGETLVKLSHIIFETTFNEISTFLYYSVM